MTDEINHAIRLGEKGKKKKMETLESKCVLMWEQSFSKVSPPSGRESQIRRERMKKDRKTRHGQKFEVEVSQINIDLLISCNNTHACEY